MDNAKKTVSNNSEDGMQDDNDNFIMDKIYPDPCSAFLFQPKSLDEIKSTATIFLDTNVLLLPYITGKSSLKLIEHVYSELVRQERLIIPSRVMQEFMKNAPSKIRDTFQSISRQRNILLSTEKFPFLENIPEYEELLNVRKLLLEKVREYQNAAGKVIDVLKDWHHDDPVRHLYCRVFTRNQFRGINDFDEDLFEKDLEFRYLNKIPPGYKDSSKADAGVGDLLIWKTILEVGSEKKCDAIFVCGEEKSDWWVRSEKQMVVVRLELVEEYRRVSGGKTFRLISMADFLELFDASEEIVEEVRGGQDSADALVSFARQNASEFSMQAEYAAADWVTSHYSRPNPSPHHFDFQIVDPFGAIHLFEVKALYDGINIARRIRDIQTSVTRAVHNDANIKKVTAIFVFGSEDTASEAAERLISKQTSYPEWLEIVIGFMSKTNKFIEVGFVAGTKEHSLKQGLAQNIPIP